MLTPDGSGRRVVVVARMLSRVCPSFCPVCRRGPAGVDCPDASRSKKAQRAREKREWRRDNFAEMRKVS